MTDDDYAARLAQMSDYEFQRELARQCRAGDRAAANRQPEPQPGVVRDDGELDHMSDGEFSDYLRSLGVNTRLQEPLSETVARDQARQERERKSRQFDEVLEEWRRRRE